MTNPPITSATAPAVGAHRRLGFGRLRGAAWISEARLVLATTAGVFAFDLESGATEELFAGQAQWMALSPDRATLAVATGRPREIQILSARDGALGARIPGHGALGMNDLCFSPDGRLVASGGNDRALRLRRADTGEEIAVCSHPEGFLQTSHSPEAITFTPSGDRVITVDSDGTVYVWTLDGELVTSWQAGRWVHDILVLPDGEHLVMAGHPSVSVISGGERYLHVRRLDGAVVREVPTPSPGIHRDLRALARSPDGAWIAAGGEDEHVHLVDTARWERAAVLTRDALLPAPDVGPLKKLTLQNLAFSTDGRHLLVITGPYDYSHRGEYVCTLQIFRVEDQRRVACLTDFLSTVNGLALAPSGEIGLATDQGAMLLDPDTGSRRLLWPEAARSIALSPDGARAAIGGDSFRGEARVVDAATAAPLREIPVLKDKVDDLAWSPDGVHIATACKQGQIWKDGRKSAVKVTREHTDAVQGVAFSPDGRVLATASWDGTLRLWDAPKFTLRHTLVNPDDKDRFNAAAFSPDGALVAAVGYSGKVHLFKTGTGAHVRALSDDAPRRGLWAVAFSPDGSVIADGGWEDGLIRLFRVEDGALLRTLPGHGDRISKIAFSADGARLHSASEDGTVRIWAVAG